MNRINNPVVNTVESKDWSIFRSVWLYKENSWPLFTHTFKTHWNMAKIMLNTCVWSANLDTENFVKHLNLLFVENKNILENIKQSLTHCDRPGVREGSLSKDRKKRTHKESPKRKITNSAGSVWLSLFMDSSGKGKLPSTASSTRL